ncbi:MAG: DMT family transporter [Ferruginibacter sp.]|nr:DMT family transporter [Ferruginibacter sp.]
MSNNKLFNWFIFITLSIIWGSSFVLIKEGLVSLTAFQVASLRIISSGLVLLPVAIRHFTKVPKNKLIIIFLSGVLGSLLPAYLFCMAEEHIDSSLAGTLNALTPVFVIIMGALLFKRQTPTIKIIGICISLAGSILLFFAQPGFKQNSNFIDVLFVVIATLCYGINVNMVGKYLNDIPSLHIAAIALVFNAIPAMMVLYFTGYFKEDILSGPMLVATGYTFVLGILGTAVASILFYMLLKRAGVVFSSMVTYAIPVVAVMWGIVYGEKVGWKQLVCLGIILSGVYVANLTKKPIN